MLKLQVWINTFLLRINHRLVWFWSCRDSVQTADGAAVQLKFEEVLLKTGDTLQRDVGFTNIKFISFKRLKRDRSLKTSETRVKVTVLGPLRGPWRSNMTLFQQILVHQNEESDHVNEHSCFRGRAAAPPPPPPPPSPSRPALTGLWWPSLSGSERSGRVLLTSDPQFGGNQIGSEVLGFPEAGGWKPGCGRRSFPVVSVRVRAFRIRVLGLSA